MNLNNVVLNTHGIGLAFLISLNNRVKYYKGEGINIIVKAFVIINFLTISQFSMANSCNNPKVMWKPTPSDICNATWGIIRAAKATHNPSLDKRFSCNNNYKGQGPAMLITTHKGIYNSLMDYRRGVSGLQADRAIKRVQMYIEPNYIPVSNGRMAVGIAITDPAKPGKKISGGTLIKDQDGSSVRLNFKVSTKNGKRQITAQGYSYHLNRTNKQVVSGGFSGQTALKHYGTGPELKTPFPIGKWFTIEMDVKLNDVGKSNGSLKLSLIEGSKVIESATMANLNYRKNAKWKIISPYMTDKYNDQKTTTATGAVAYKNHEILTCNN